MTTTRTHDLALALDARAALCAAVDSAFDALLSAGDAVRAAQDVRTALVGTPHHEAANHAVTVALNSVRLAGIAHENAIRALAAHDRAHP